MEEHLGRRSVTEMEILHGVLNNPEMAGQAYFYFRDPAWSQAQSEPGFVCDSDEEAEKLADLKQRIRNSRFPVEEDLPDPKALAARIGEVLWALIEEQFPELDQLDALEREERKLASYRRSRTELAGAGGNCFAKPDWDCCRGVADRSGLLSYGLFHRIQRFPATNGDFSRG